MEKYLLDTHALLWFARKSSQLSEKGYSIISDIKNNIFVSDISIWEIATKMKIGKLDFELTVEELCKYITNLQFEWLSIDKTHIIGTLPLPLHHRDPFDRMLIAQAKTEKMTIITRDTNFSKYDIDVLW